MALRLLKSSSSVLSYATSVIKPVRCMSSSKKLDEQITVTDDGSTIVFWHPEPHFPYECSRPIPENKQETLGAMKVQSLDEVRSIFKEKKEEFVRQELMNITYTTKHRWFPRSRDKYRREIPPDREYL
ncbi:hypothetical protein ANN_00753 [Periplaneta americana]|uniref:Large ribosomal subunit protein mL42 n=1 Tax=Periplaneta americana TaxID=6978 RepID=A0ABQ8TVP1_PERAM|nr:hypothetical protein ANN_00753 [Periplaneta americana]